MEDTTYTLAENCYVCDRVRWGSYVYIGCGRWRHRECFPGSSNWMEHYPTFPKEKKSIVGDNLYDFITWQKTKGKDIKQLPIFLTEAIHEREECSNETEAL